MCVSKQLNADPKEVTQRYSRPVSDQVKEHLNYWYAGAFDRPMWPVITAEQPDEIQLMQWCMVPKGVRDPTAYAAKTYNARMEEMYETKTYKDHIAAGRRCLIPCTGFFEHRHEGGQTYPYRIHMPAVPIFSLAGVYNADTRTYAVITTEANELMKRVHNQARRQPVIIPPPLEDLWVRGQLDKTETQRLCEPIASEQLEAYTISKLLTRRGVDRNVAEVQEPVEYPVLTMLDAMS